jgi:hypothetical protein
MTLKETSFCYVSPPRESQLRALDHARDVYGMRQLSFDEQACVIHVEYDASRLSEDDVAALLRAAGIALSVNGIAHQLTNDSKPTYERTKQYLARL